MKKIFSIILSGICVFSVTSCKKYLDINNDPNRPTAATPAVVLPQALTATASLIVNTGDFNTYGSQLNGYFGNAGGFGSLGTFISYAYTTGDLNGLFTTTFDNLQDYQYIIDNSPAGSKFNAAANIMKAYDYQLLVDTYNDVPYSEALQGVKILQPKYDKAADIYKDLGDKLDAAIAVMKAATTDNDFKGADPLFGGSVLDWAKFANTLKLRLIIRAGNKVTFTKPTPDAATGFITTNASVNPGYTKIINKQNPYWNRWAYSETDQPRTAGNVYMPSDWIITFFDGSKLTDDVRGQLIFKEYNGSATPSNQLGYTEADAPKSPTPNFWYTYEDQGKTGLGLFKGEAAPQPLMLAAESYFLQAEANLKTILAGSAKDNFQNGIKASFNYLFLSAGANSTRTVVEDPTPYFNAYLTDNDNKYLVAYDKFTIADATPTTPAVTRATTDAEKLEAIITQKYLGLIYQFGAETWNEYRRTGYPKVSGNSSTTTFASAVSQATGPDKLPTRILYPVSEYTYNSSHVPSGVSPYTDKIFWAK